MHLPSGRLSSLALAALTACGGAARDTTPTAPRVTVPVDARGDATPDPDLAPPPEPARRRLAIDWSTLPLATDEDALAAWAQIAPTGADWEEKLEEVPVAVARPLARALLRSGNFACATPPAASRCARAELEIPAPAETAGLDDPCLRRLLALWAVAALEPEDVPPVLDALRAIAALPPPESQLVAAAIEAIPETEHATRLELLTIAYHAGQRELANSLLGSLDEAHLIEAVTRHHIDGALEVLSAQAHRDVYLAAITDEALAPAARAQAITELVAEDELLAPDAKKALVAATKATDCTVAATAARALAVRGDRRFVPRRPAGRSQPALMRALCVLASYERLQMSDEVSLLPSFVPAKGLERIEIAFDPLSDVDADGDGDPHTARTEVLVPRAEVVVPEIEDLIRAFSRCTGTTCTSADREFRFGLRASGGQLYLARLEIVELPPCR